MKKSSVLLHACMAIALVVSSPAWPAERQAKFAVAEKQMQTLGITLAALQPKSEPVIVSVPAQVIVPPNREYVITSPLAGLPVQIFVQQNQAVKQGAPLLRIVSAELGQLQLQVLQTSSRAALARQAAQRERALLQEGIIPERRVQEPQAALNESEAALNQAKAALRLAGLSPVAIDRITQSGKLEDGLTLYAIQAGIVTGIDVKLGQRVEPTSALMRLTQTSKLWLDIQVAAADANAWKPGNQLKLPGSVDTARIISVSPIVTAGSQTVSVRAEVESTASALRPGELVTVTLSVSAATEGWDVPLAAVVRDASATVVFVRTGDGFEARPVKVIANAGQRARIQGQLKAGDKIAVTGVVALKGAWMDEKGGK